MTDTNRPASYEHQVDIQEFHQWVEKNQIKGIQGNVESSRCVLLPFSILKTCFTPRYLRQLNEALLGTEGFNFNVKDILDDYCKVFCILLEIGKGEYIEYFLQHSSLCDQKLPFEPESRPQNFPNDPNDPKFFVKFCEKQWLLCAPEFKKKSKSRYRKELILPIIESTYLSQGGSARVYKIKLHQCYDKFDEPKNPEVNEQCIPLIEVLRALAKFKQTQESQNPKTYILKQYHTETAQRDYNAEVKAYRLLSRVPNVIKFYMSYEQGNTYNVILEYADEGTLEDYWRNTTPPSTGIDIYHFFEGMFDLAQAVRGIHDPSSQGEDGKERLQGWHQDINPLNIFVQSSGSESRESPFNYKFKLGDFGISHFKSRSASRRQATDLDTSGTRTYGAPETYRPNSSWNNTRLHVSLTVDIWSLGTVWSEACIWVAYGMEGLNHYRQVRGAATEVIEDFTAGNCFHDGFHVLKDVEKMHNMAQRDLRRSDFLTHEVWLRLIKPNLISCADARLNATDLWKLSADVLAKAKAKGMLHDSSLSRKEFLQPPKYGVGTLPRKRARSFGKPNDGRNYDLFSNANRSLSNPVVQLDGGPQTDSLGIRSLTGCQIIDEDTLDQGFQEQLSGDDTRSGSVSRRAQQSNGYCEPCPPENGIIRSGGSSYSWSSNSKGRTPSADAATDDASQSLHPSTPHDRTSISREYTWLAEDAIRWRKTKSNHKFEFSRREEQLKKFHHNHLNGRDHVFLLDDSSSMSPHWDEVSELLGVLAHIVKKYNREGTKLYFTTTDGPSPQKKTTSLVNAVRIKKPEGYSDMKGRLGQLLDDYRTHDLGRRRSFRLPKTTRPFTLYIFTNGLWEDNIDVQKPIENIVKYLEEQRKSSRTVGIQFIRFGDDSEGGERLDYLDKRLNLSSDIVDAELSTGNVYKMLLGSIDKYFDNDQSHSIRRSTGFHPTCTKPGK